MLDKLLALIRGDVVILQRLFKQQITETSSLKTEIKNVRKQLDQQKPPIVNVSPPKVDVNVPDVHVPEIKLPEFNIPDVKIPEIKIPPIKVPKPEVTVNIPPFKFPRIPVPVVNVEPPKVEVNIPDEMEVKGFSKFTQTLLNALQTRDNPEAEVYTAENPLPVILTDTRGDFYKAVMTAVSSSGGGGGGSKDPLEPYKIADIDDDDTVKYYGFTDKNHDWYILKEDTTAKTYRYTTGNEDYPDNWTNRASLTYDYFHNIF